MRPLLLAVLAFPVVGAVCHPANAGTPAPAGQGRRHATVHEVLTDARLVGSTLDVTGHCLGYSTPTIAKGSPPLTRSDWQLEDAAEAAWVSGPLPQGCTATEPSPGPVTITARVARDTLQGLGGGAPIPRQYLVR